ncbi:hypothetical protein [Mechercharimyces sp. CAU 1602]|uniref:hypothetical protein n=1 Tax=Mechercharimyces sp. CAU 1602 TaxID=2973933 RepID=UPI0021611BB9|nr:hypothetical protein [Mechercharimyces sp. CAU 1602]MCS1351031.1 hypothetical protein [Mechercharimyces sp. CAU 1602]
MKVRAVQATTALVVTLILLFGGYFAFQWLKVEKPLQAYIQTHSELTIVDQAISPNHIELSLKASPSFDATSYRALYQQMEEIGGHREITIRFVDNENSSLQSAWEQISFLMYEYISLEQYGEIPPAVERISTLHGVEGEVVMDEKAIYLLLQLEEEVAFYRLPLLKSVTGGEQE